MPDAAASRLFLCNYAVQFLWPTECKEEYFFQTLRTVLKIALHTIRSFITFYGNSHALNSNPRAREYFITFHTLYTESKISRCRRIERVL